MNDVDNKPIVVRFELNVLKNPFLIQELSQSEKKNLITLSQAG